MAASSCILADEFVGTFLIFISTEELNTWSTSVLQSWEGELFVNKQQC